MKKTIGSILSVLALLMALALAVPAVAQNVPWVKAEQASTMPVNQKINIRCKILSVLHPPADSRAPITVNLVDSTGRIAAIIFQQTWGQIEDKSFIVAGAQVDIHGTTDEFRGTRQIKIENPRHIRLVPGSLAPEAQGAVEYMKVNIGAVNSTTIGMQVKLVGEVTKHAKTDKENVPTKLLIRDETGEIEVIYWVHTEAKVEPKHRPVMGKLIEVSGIVSEYRSKMQLRVDHAEHIRRPDADQPEGAATADPFAAAGNS